MWNRFSFMLNKLIKCWLKILMRFDCNFCVTLENRIWFWNTIQHIQKFNIYSKRIVNKVIICSDRSNEIARKRMWIQFIIDGGRQNRHWNWMQMTWNWFVWPLKVKLRRSIEHSLHWSSWFRHLGSHTHWLHIARFHC